MTYRFLAALALVSAVLPLVFPRLVHAADSTTTATTATTLRLTSFGDPHSLMPILATVATEGDIDGMLYDSLVAYDGANVPHPRLAADVPTPANHGISGDGKTFTFHLRRNVKWQDGAPFTAADVVFTMHAILDPKNVVANRSLYSDIERVDAIDRYTVAFHLRNRKASFLAVVGDGYPIMPAHLLEKTANLATDPLNSQPVGTGPYRLVRWNRGERLEFEANPDYFLGAPRFKRITMSIIPDSNTESIALRQHEIDFATVDSSGYNQLRDATGILRKTEPYNDFVAYALNEKRPLLRDRRVRLAITKAVDRDTITRNITFGTGTPAYGDLPFFMYGGRVPAGWKSFDPAAAMRLLDEAGWKAGPDGIRQKNGNVLRLEMISFSGSASGTSAAIQIQQMLRHVGIDTEVKSFSPSLYFSPASAGGPVSSGKFDLASYTFQGGSDPTNDELYSCAGRLPNGFNAANYCNPKMESLQAAAEREYNPGRRNKIFQQIEDLAVRDATYLFVYHTPYRIVQNPLLQRPTASQGTQWYDINTWTFREGISR